ncbi:MULTISPECIES: ParB/RepB/Spo0J family partition protein [unclassified Mesorhizobium]|uniref:ParB/RepB/Spo0J family partition protein n=1 Tax=unclassified Mesorhizobium TaxID=325217 RepID=UPI000FCA55D5|nr:MULTISPECIES: ParB/RepB/Spo0J family partition protein [unclassified Mesorhizobium]RUV98354.1 ParB/RepB/Spo0J family partition protein [Mesorhizobium sp. M1A.F.Ca.IN.020.04.1.1]RUW16318.1 ParB/RepB/Spo0J family partition protein [Mesorhizobium sp. M1A.F.Ca.IN.020.03.1.1]RWF75310.1 MAG: ParB/RepB/Spo0J family partition protein [Mesorhizobium sp.]RWG15812.1 MAG: ParB/RepB/Spo0J family partition protein [Mesorhizobium sp.]RWG31388.1 MAG: ParB/RepB/Spo0J family partition protein [Mesorhizobium 
MKKRIPLSEVIPNPDQPRKHFDPVKLRELAESIRERGLIQAITVRPVGDDPWMIVGGERRWRAHQLIDSPDILCEVVKIDDNEMALQAIVENLARADIKPLEEARAFQAMIDRGWTVEQLAKDIGVQPTRIKARTALLNLDETIQKLVDSGAFPLGHANDLVDLPTADQINIVRLFSSGKLKDWSSIKAAAQAVRDRIEQGGMFDDENRPEPSKDDIAALSRMKKTVKRIIAAIAGGFKDGECIALKSVDPSKADKWADTLAAASRSIRSMESQLRQAHARSMLV